MLFVPIYALVGTRNKCGDTNGGQKSAAHPTKTDMFCYVTLSTRRYSGRNFFFHRGHLSPPLDSLWWSSTCGIARCHQNCPIAPSFYCRCLGFVAFMPFGYDHLHCIWILPPGDADYPMRWNLIKRMVSLACSTHYHRADWDDGIQNETPWINFLATALLGTLHHHTTGLFASSWLHCYQSVETWLGDPRAGLAVFYFSPRCCKGYLFVGLGRGTRYAWFSIWWWTQVGWATLFCPPYKLPGPMVMRMMFDIPNQPQNDGINHQQRN